MVNGITVNGVEDKWYKWQIVQMRSVPQIHENIAKIYFSYI